MVCSLNFKKKNPAATWLKEALIRYAGSDTFRPKHEITIEQLRALASGKVKKVAANTNLAFNANDKTAVRGKRK